jgi:hypothetical protein
MVSGIPERLTEFTRNFVHGKPSKEICSHRRSLLVVQLLQALLDPALRSVRSCNTGGSPDDGAGLWRVCMRIGEVAFGRNLVLRHTAASWYALRGKGLAPSPRLRPCSAVPNTPSEIHPANTGRREPETRGDCLWLPPGTNLRQEESEAGPEREAVSRRSSLPLTCRLDKHLATERRGWGQRQTRVQHERSAASEGQHTTDLYEMKDQQTCRSKVYFFVAVVQLGPRLRSARSPRLILCERFTSILCL